MHFCAPRKYGSKAFSINPGTIRGASLHVILSQESENSSDVC